MDYALTLVARGRPMKTVCRVLGCARSHVHALDQRGDDRRDGRTCRTPYGDTQLLSEIREQIADLPSYGYRRACALVNRQRAAQDSARVNSKRAYRVIAEACLLLPKESQPADNSSEGHFVTITRSPASNGWVLMREPPRTISTPGDALVTTRAEEDWHAMYQVARLMNRAGYPDGSVVNAYMKAFDYRPTRAEPLVWLACFFRHKKMWSASTMVLTEVAKLPLSTDRLFVEVDCYGWRRTDEFALVLYHLGDKDDAKKLWESLLQPGKLPASQLNRIQQNLKYC